MGLFGKDKITKLYDKAFDLADKNNHEECIKYYNKIIEINSNEFKAWRGKGLAFSALEKEDEAIICFDKALEIKLKIREYRAKQKFPFKDSKPELFTQSILKEHGIKFKKHHNFKLSDSNHQADIVIEPNHVIEVFGDYWHFNPKKYDVESIQKVRRKEIKVKDVWKYDKYVIDGMKEQGYKVLVVWESELKDELEKTTKKILKFINR